MLYNYCRNLHDEMIFCNGYSLFRIENEFRNTPSTCHVRLNLINVSQWGQGWGDDWIVRKYGGELGMKRDKQAVIISFIYQRLHNEIYYYFFFGEWLFLIQIHCSAKHGSWALQLMKYMYNHPKYYFPCWWQQGIYNSFCACWLAPIAVLKNISLFTMWAYLKYMQMCSYYFMVWQIWCLILGQCDTQFHLMHFPLKKETKIYILNIKRICTKLIGFHDKVTVPFCGKKKEICMWHYSSWLTYWLSERIYYLHVW